MDIRMDKIDWFTYLKFIGSFSGPPKRFAPIFSQTLRLSVFFALFVACPKEF
jgi:hypothetical protein